MTDELEARGAGIAARRVAAILDRLAAAELPAGLVAERNDDAVAIQGRGLVRRLAFDARLAALRLLGGRA